MQSEKSAHQQNTVHSVYLPKTKNGKQQMQRQQRYHKN